MLAMGVKVVLEDYISSDRLKIYTDVLKLKQEEALGGYNWNKALCSAMQPLMHCLEVTLRNSIDHAIRNESHPGIGSRWRTDSNWVFDLPRYMGDKAFIRTGERYKKDPTTKLPLDGRNGRRPVYDKSSWEELLVRKTGKRIKDAGKMPTAERVIAGLEFGFWTNLLTKYYEEPRNNTLLWPYLLPKIFTGMPTGTNRQAIEDKFNRIRELRNRLAHHEAIWKFQYLDHAGKPDYSNPVYGLAPSLSLLRKAWDDMLEALYWISPSRHAAFLAEGHHHRFETLATKEGLLSFIERSHISKTLNVRRSIKHLLRQLDNGEIIRVTNRSQTLAIVGQDYIRK